MIIHYYLADIANDGDLYLLGVSGNDSNEILDYLESQYKEVIYLESKEKNKRHRKHGSKEIPYGTIVTCKFYCDRCQSLTRSKKILKHDRRFTTWQ